MKTRLILIRHGEAEGNFLRRFHGHTDSDLTENGHLQAKATADYLKDEPIDVIYSSDLKRTMETAGYIARQRSLSIHKRSGLREINGGDWEDLPWDELPQKFPESFNHWLNLPHLLCMPSGESMVDFQARVNKEIENIISENIGKNICIVAHGTAIKVMVCLWRGVGLDRFPELPWYDNASVTIVEIQNGRYTLIKEGENAHLGELSTLAKQDEWWKSKK